MEQKRFFVDERGGCVAVRDRNKVDQNWNGLSPNMDCVVKFWMGVNSDLLGWSVDPDDVQDANELCELLNAGVEATKAGAA